MKQGCSAVAVFVGIFLLLFVAPGAFYTVEQTEQVVVTQFGKPIGGPIVEPGLHFKLPFIQTVNRMDKRFLEWDGAPVGIPTKDKTYIHVDAFGRWRIKDPLQFFLRLRDERSAQSRLEDILGSEIRNSIAKHELIEIVRTDKNRKPKYDETLAPTQAGGVAIGTLRQIEFGRGKVEAEIKTAAAAKLAEFGIELLDLRLKRVNYNTEVLERIYQRMISERQQIAQRFRSEGEGEAARVAGQTDRDLNEIQSTAYREVQRIRGEADAKASEIYARAYTSSPQAAEFYAFLKSMETYRKVIARDTTMVLSTDSDLFHLMKRVEASGKVVPAPESTPAVPPPALPPTTPLPTPPTAPAPTPP